MLTRGAIFDLSRGWGERDWNRRQNRGPPQTARTTALDNIDLNLVSHRYVSGVLKDDHFISALI